MSVYQTPNSPFWQFDFQRGNRRFHGSTKERTKRAALAVERDEIRKAEAEIARHGRVEAVTLDRAAGEYWDNVGRHKASAATIEYQIENLVRLIGARTTLDRIRDPEIAAFVAARRGEETARSRQRRTKAARARRKALRERRNHIPDLPPAELMAPASVNREIELLARVLKRAARVLRARMPDEADRPVWSLHKLVEPDPPDRPLTAEQETKLFAELVPHARPIVALDLLLGLRRNEVMTLDCANLDFAARRGKVRRKSRKPGGEWFTFPITEAAIAILAPHVAGRSSGPVWRYGHHCDCAVCRKKANHGKPIRSIRTAFEGARRRAGNEAFRIHDLRHTTGSRILAGSGNLKAAQDYLGHRDISTTVRYAHHAPNAMDDLQRMLAAATPERHETSPESRNNPEVVAATPKKRSNTG